jgi:hypothetical protein
MDPSFSFQQLFNLSVFALTPGCLIVAIYSTMNFDVVRQDLIYFSCYCLFLILASGECRAALRAAKEGKSVDDEEEE